MTVNNLAQLKQRYEKLRREEQRARSDMSRCEEQADNQQQQLNRMHEHREQCVDGLRNARDSGLNIVQIREYQLLLKHLEGVVHEQQQKVDISQVNYEKASDVWNVRQEAFRQVEEQLKAAEAAERERKQQEINADKDADSKKQHYGGLTGRRLTP